MSRNEITLQEMFSSVIGELRESGRWGTAHIYQSAVNAFSAFTKWQPMPMRKLSPTVLKRFENFLSVSSGSGQKVHTVCTQTVRACIYRHTGGQEEGARSIRHQQPGKGDGKEPARRDAPKHTAENKDFLRTHVHAQGHTLCGSGIPAQKGPAGKYTIVQTTEDGTGADRITHTRSHADGQDGGEQEPRLPLSVSHPAERGRHGSGIPGIPVGTQGIQPAAGSTQAVPGNAVGTQYLCSQTHLGHNGLPLRDTPRNHIGSHGTLLHHGDGNLSETFQQQKD